ncbi:MAG: hypothetical protein EBT08_01395 [Betaproteobacteria bacterium]|nr:hypothetical protein [Betaproteobacteria bacterium]
MALDRSAILSRAKGKVERVEVPEWADVIHLREISASERDNYEGNSIEAKGMAKWSNMRAKLLCLCICDEAGNRLFGDADIMLVGQLPAGLADRLWHRCLSLCGLSKDDVDALEKNSVSDQPAA